MKLPEGLKVHPTFYVSFLKPFHEDLVDGKRQQAKRSPRMIQMQYNKEDEPMDKILGALQIYGSKIDAS